MLHFVNGGKGKIYGEILVWRELCTEVRKYRSTEDADMRKSLDESIYGWAAFACLERRTSGAGGQTFSVILLS
ncbi:hypothetical protein [Cohnella luojiensis]|uniref:Uncharacterized protein n=1 Tax=Cohnella luojiensis TaxID=652876 RepID=A0A4Y8LUK7_9BACL|nr:hypothetical protein [Cohnella luojiensis]TFE24538.1 hypothetical protein E2980_15940 [Cohnella luojiensis]